MYQHSTNKIGVNGVDVWKKNNITSGARTSAQPLILCCCQDENGKEMYQNMKKSTCGACGVIVFTHCCFVVFLRPQKLPTMFVHFSRRIRLNYHRSK